MDSISDLTKMLLNDWPQRAVFPELWYTDSKALDHEGVARVVLFALNRSFNVETSFNRLLEGGLFSEAQTLISFLELHGEDSARIEILKRRLAVSLRGAALNEYISNWKKTESENEEILAPLLPPPWPWQEDWPSSLRWMVQQSSDAAAPVGFYPRYSLQPDDELGRRFLTDLRGLFGEPTQDESSSPAECLLSLGRIFGAESPELVQSEGCSICRARAGSSPELARLCATDCSDLLLLLPYKRDFVIPSHSGHLLVFDPLGLVSSLPQGSMSLRLESIAAALPDVSNRSRMIIHEVARQLPLAHFFPDSAHSGFSNVSDLSPEGYQGISHLLVDQCHSAGVSVERGAIRLLIDMAGSVPQLALALLETAAQALGTTRGRRYGPIRQSDIIAMWQTVDGKPSAASQWSEKVTNWLRGLGDNHVLKVLLEDAATLDLSGGMPSSNLEMLVDCLDQQPLDAIVTELAQLQRHGLIESIPSEEGERFRLRESGLIWWILDLFTRREWQ